MSEQKQHTITEEDVGSKAYNYGYVKRLETEVEKLEKLVSDLYPLAIVYAAQYQRMHELKNIHPVHAEIIGRAKLIADKIEDMAICSGCGKSLGEHKKEDETYFCPGGKKGEAFDQAPTDKAVKK